MLSASCPVGSFMKRSDLDTGPRLGVDLLPEERWISAAALMAGRSRSPFFSQTDGDVILRDHQHATRAAARIVDRAHDALVSDSLFVAGQHQIHHQVQRRRAG